MHMPLKCSYPSSATLATLTPNLSPWKNKSLYFSILASQAWLPGMWESGFKDQMIQFHGECCNFSIYTIYLIFPSYFKRILHIFSLPPFYTTYIQLPVGTSVSNKLKNDPRYWPFFQDAVGALNGSHIHASPPAFQRTVYCNHKGFVLQNCLFTCDFDLKFVYSLTGWEGSANDSRIYEDVCVHDFHILHQKYYLADAGFPLCAELLVPYHGVCYHLAEWGCANTRYVFQLICFLTYIFITGQPIKKSSSIYIMHLHET